VRAMTSAERARRYREIRNASKPKKMPPPMPAKLLPGPLTAQIAKDSFVRRLIDASFPNLNSISRASNQKLRNRGLSKLPRVHEQKVVAMLAGTAIDYRIRAYFRRDVHRSGMVERGLFFFQRWSQKGGHLDGLVDSFERFVARVKPERRKLNRRTEERMCRYCILFAYLDFIGRAPLGNSAIEVLTSIANRDLEKTLSRLDAAIAVDVIGLSRRFYDNHATILANAREVIVGGTFAGSADIGGADFDLLVDGCLIDFKASREAKITTQHLRQLIGYWLLDYDDALKIRSCAFSLLRHGHTEYFDIQRDLLPADNFVALRATFKSELQRAGKKGMV
jgi:hypothetical protein